MRVFQEEIFGPVLAVTTFKDEAEALELANDTLYGLGAGVWTRDGARAYRMGRAIKAGRVWTNCYHLYPAHAAFGGYKISGVGRENHRMMLDHYTQTKCLLGPEDLLIGEIATCPFYMDREQYERWGRPRFLIDCAPGGGDSFSLESMEGMHFIERTQSVMLTRLPPG